MEAIMVETWDPEEGTDECWLNLNHVVSAKAVTWESDDEEANEGLDPTPDLETLLLLKLVTGDGMFVLMTLQKWQTILGEK